MIYTCIQYPSPGLVYIFVQNDSRVSFGSNVISYDIYDTCTLIFIYDIYVSEINIDNQNGSRRACRSCC